MASAAAVALASPARKMRREKTEGIPGGRQGASEGRSRASARCGGEGKGDADGWSEEQDLISREPRRVELTRLRRREHAQKMKAGGGVGLKG